MRSKLLTSTLCLAMLCAAPTLRAATNVVTIGNFFFNPTNVTINIGDTIKWTNAVATPTSGTHDVSRTNTPFNWGIGPDLTSSSRVYFQTFSNSGTYAYFCNRHVNAPLVMNRHPEQTGTVSVVSINLSPSVSITNPANNAVFATPANVTIQATASDSDGSITNVQFLVGTAVAGNDTTLPYSATTNGLPAGNYTLSAIASDNGGARATNSISIIVNAPPTVSVTNPVANAKFRAPTNLLLQASASDTDGTVTNVQFFSNSGLLGNDASSPFQLASGDLAAGNYSFTASATDNRGHSTTSAVINVSVLTNAFITSPTLLPDGKFALTIEGITGQTYATEGSADLATWSAFATNVAPANTFNVTDTTSTNVLIRYYRARQDL